MIFLAIAIIIFGFCVDNGLSNIALGLRELAQSLVYEEDTK